MNSLHRFAQLTAGFTFFLLFAGGMVTSTGSGLAVPDWPLSYGRFFPRMIGGVFFEHGHRMLAAAVGLMTFSLAAWIIAKREGPVRRVAAAAAFGILLQAALGGITVLYLLPPGVSIAHACLGQVVFCLILTAAELTSDWYGSAKPSLEAGFWLPGASLAAAVCLQLFLGAVLRHTGLGLAWHIVGAFAVLAALGAVAKRTFSEAQRQAPLANPVFLLIAAFGLQFLLGAASAIGRLSPGGGALRALVPTAHLALGALILGAALVWTLRAQRLAKP